MSVVTDHAFEPYEQSDISIYCRHEIRGPTGIPGCCNLEKEDHLPFEEKHSQLERSVLENLEKEKT